MPPPHREWLRQLVGALQEGCAALERVLDDWPESDAEEGRSEVRRDAQHVISLFDYTTLALQPWKRRGYEVHAYDLRHPPGHTITASGLHLWGVDLTNEATLREIGERHAGKAAFAWGFPECTDLSRAGANSWQRKAAINPDFQTEAAHNVRKVDAMLSILGCPYCLENPSSSALRSLWRPPDHTFEPCWYGGYLALDDVHPLYPAHVPSRDAYTKRTGLWVGGGFSHLPQQRRVDAQWKVWEDHNGKRRRISPPMFSGSHEARMARQATPRGFAEALCQHYAR
jgi:hypothetical protein